MQIEPIFLLIALLPLIGYLLQLGLIRASGKCLVTTGGRDIAALGFSVAGLVAIGPGELFFPKAAAGVFGPWVWLALLAFYSLIVALIALTSRPRLVVYGRTPDQLLDPLLESARELDSDATSDPEKLEVFLPKLNVRLRVAGPPGIYSASVESFQPVVSASFWNAMLSNMRQRCVTASGSPKRRFSMMLVWAVLLAAVAIWQGFGQQEQVVQGFRDWFWR